MRVKLKINPNKEQLSNRYCTFGITDEIGFSDLFGMDTTFIGAITKVNEDSNEYRFSVDRIERGRIQTLRTLDAENKADLRYLKLALECDYGFAPDEYEVVME